MIEDKNFWIVLIIAITTIGGIEFVLRRSGTKMSRTIRMVLHVASWGIVAWMVIYSYVEGNYSGMFAAVFGAAIPYLQKAGSWFFNRYDRFIDRTAGNVGCNDNTKSSQV